MYEVRKLKEKRVEPRLSRASKILITPYIIIIRSVDKTSIQNPLFATESYTKMHPLSYLE